MKKILAILLVVVMAATAIIGGTLAYFTDTDDATNTFTVGNVDIVLSEPAWTEEGGGEDQGEDAYPGEPLPKDPTVTNEGSNPCFVRISVEGLDQFGEDNMITYRTGYTVGALGEGWVLHTDGYFYYSEVLPAGEDTTALFTSIVIPTGLTNEHSNEDGYDVDVTAEAVQAQGAKPSWSAVQTMTVEEIAAWFTTCGL